MQGQKIRGVKNRSGADRGVDYRTMADTTLTLFLAALLRDEVLSMNDIENTLARLETTANAAVTPTMRAYARSIAERIVPTDPVAQSTAGEYRLRAQTKSIELSAPNRSCELTLYCTVKDTDTLTAKFSGRDLRLRICEDGSLKTIFVPEDLLGNVAQVLRRGHCFQWGRLSAHHLGESCMDICIDDLIVNLDYSQRQTLADFIERRGAPAPEAP